MIRLRLVREIYGDLVPATKAEAWGEFKDWLAYSLLKRKRPDMAQIELSPQAKQLQTIMAAWMNKAIIDEFIAGCRFIDYMAGTQLPHNHLMTIRAPNDYQINRIQPAHDEAES